MSPEVFTSTLFQGLGNDEAICYVRKTDNGWIQQRRPFTDLGPDYYCVSSVKPLSERGLRLKRRKQDLAKSYVVVCDDVGTKAQAAPIEPTYKLETSAGNFQHGYAIEPCEPALFEACMRSLAEAGYTDPGTLDAGRVMRTPGSVNDKPGRGGFSAKLLSFDHERRWAILDLMAELGLEPGETERGRPVQPAPLPEGVVVEDVVFDWLVDRKMVLREGSDGWYFIQCPWAHLHLGDPREDAKYSPLGIGDFPMIRGFSCFHSHDGLDFTGDDFLAWVAAQGGPRVPKYDRSTVQRRIEELRFGQPEPEPAELPLWHTEHERIEAMPSRTPEQLVDQVAERYVFSKYEGAYYRKDTQELLYVLPKNMPLGYPQMVDTMTPAGRPTRKPAGSLAMMQAGVVDRIDFRPGANLVFREGGLAFLNTYRPPVHLPAAARDTSAFDDVLTRIACLDEERAYLLQWIAYKLQHPWVRGPAVLSLSMQEGEDQNQGSGRGTMIRLLRVLFGERYITELSFDALAGKNYQSQYTDWLAGTLWAVVSEAKDTSTEHLTRRNARVSAYERVKDIAEPGTTQRQIVRKGLPNTDQRVYTSLLIASNHADVMEVPRDDRRLFVCRSALASEVDRDFWIAVHREIDDPAFVSALYHRLMTFDTSAFHPYEPVPMTETKQLLFDSTETELDVHIEEFLDWLPGRVITLRMVSALWSRYERENKIYGITGSAVYGEVKRRVLRPVKNDPKWKIRVGEDFHRPRLLPGPVVLHNREMLVAYCKRELEKNIQLINGNTPKSDFLHNRNDDDEQ